MEKPVGLRTLTYPLTFDRLSRQEMRALQWRHIQALLERTIPHNPFITKQFAAAGLKPEHLWSLEDFSRLVPFVTKLDILEDQKQHPPYGSMLGVPVERLRKMHTTSGTSGIGQERYGLTESDTLYDGLGMALCMEAAVIPRGAPCALTLPVSTNSAGQCIYHGIQMHGSHCLLLGLFDAPTKLRFMREFGAAYMVTAPAYLTRLTLLCQAEGIEPRQEFPGLRAITVATEAFPPAWAERMGEFWGCQIHELYGSTQMGTIAAWTCTDCQAARNGELGVLHLGENLGFFEVLDFDSHEPVGPGDFGELVITTFGREASPLVRFRMGDRVRLVESSRCPSGRSLMAIEAGNISRFDDMLKIKASNVYPSVIDEIIFSHVECAEYNGRVYLDKQGREQAEVSLEFLDQVVDEARRREIVQEIGTAIKQRTAVTMQVKPVAPGTLPRFEWKPRRWNDERQRGLEELGGR